MHGADVAIGKDGCSQTKEKSKSKDDCCAHECKHCGFLLKLPWKVKGSIKKEGRGGSWHAVHAGRHLEKNFNEAVRNLIKERLLEKVRKINHEEEVTEKAKNIHMELGVQKMQNKRKRGGVQQKLPSKLSCQDRCYISMDHFLFIHHHIPF